MKNAKTFALVSLLSLSGVALATSGCGSCSSTGCKVENKEEKAPEAVKVVAVNGEEEEEEENKAVAVTEAEVNVKE